MAAYLDGAISVDACARNERLRRVALWEVGAGGRGIGDTLHVGAAIEAEERATHLAVGAGVLDGVRAGLGACGGTTANHHRAGQPSGGEDAESAAKDIVGGQGGGVLSVISVGFTAMVTPVTVLRYSAGDNFMDPIWTTDLGARLRDCRLQTAGFRAQW